MIYDFRKSNLTLFYNYLNNCDFSTIIELADNEVDKKIDRLYYILRNALSTIPHTIIHVKDSDKPWITNITKALIEKRWKAYRSKNYNLYYHYKQKVQIEIQKAKRIWLAKEKKRNNKTGIWQLLKATTTSNTNNHLQQFTNNFQTLKEAANNLGQKFKQNYNYHHHQTTNYTMHKDDNNVDFTFDEFDIYHLLTKINVSKKSSDDIPSRCYKEAATFITKVITNIFNSSYKSAIFPASWKKAVIIPVSKPGKINEFRPITLTHTLSKIFEKAILQKLLTSTNIEDFYGPNQFGFRKLSNTTSAIIRIHDAATKLIDLPDSSGISIIAFDLSKAFDQIQHNLLIDKLYSKNLPFTFIKWYQDYLSQRTFTVNVMNHFSDTFDVVSGVPQGSVLSPFIFCTFVSNISVPGAITVLYADDITVVKKHCGHKNVIEDLNYVIETIDCLVSSLGLVLNKAKTQILHVPKSQTKKQIIYDGLSDVIQILGVQFNTKLNWDTHAQHISKKAYSRLYALRKLKPNLTKQELITIYNCYILSILEYANPALIGMSSLSQKLLNTVQRRAHSVICTWRCRCDILDDLSLRRATSTIKLFVQAANVDRHILHQLVPNRLPHSGHYAIPYSKTARRANSFFPTGALLVALALESFGDETFAKNIFPFAKVMFGETFAKIKN